MLWHKAIGAGGFGGAGGAGAAIALNLSNYNFVADYGSVNGGYGFRISDDGYRAWSSGRVDARQYDLTTPFDFSTRTSEVIYTPPAAFGSIYPITGICFSDNGQYVFFSSYDNRAIYRVPLSTAYDFASAQAHDQSFTTNHIGNFTFSADGTKLFTTNRTTDVYEFILTTPWDLTSAGSMTQINLTMAGGGTAYGVRFYSGGGSDHMLIATRTTGILYDYVLSGPENPYSISSTNYRSFGYTMYDVEISADGSHLYFAAGSTDTGPIVRFSV